MAKNRKIYGCGTLYRTLYVVGCTWMLIIFFTAALLSNVSQSLLILEVSRSHKTTHYSR